MTRLKGLRSRSLAAQLYAKLIPIQLLALVTVSLCTFANTLIIGATLGEGGLAEAKVVEGISNLVNVFRLLVTGGEVLLIGRAVCKGDREAADRCFSTCVAVSVLFSALLCTACLAFPSGICRFFGADDLMLPSCREALYAILPYYVAFPLASVFLAMFQIRSDLKTPIVASVVVFILSVLLSVLFLVVLKKDRVFYSNLAMSAAQVAALIYLLIRHKITKFATFSVRKITLSVTGSMLLSGFTESSTSVWQTVKGTVMIQLMSTFGGATALSCFSVITSVDAITYNLFSMAIQAATLMIAGIFIHEDDRNSLRHFVKTAFRISMTVAGILWAIMFFSARPVAIFYEVADVAAQVKAQHIFSFAFLFYMPYTVLVTLFAAMDKKKTVNILSVFTAFVVPVIAMAVLGRLFGIVGFWHGLFAGDLFAFCATFGVSVFHNKRIPRSIDELLCLDPGYAISADRTFHISIHNEREAVGASERIVAFCKERGMDRRTAYLSGLCLEEIAVNTVTHGFRHTRKVGVAEIVVVDLTDTVRLIVRDNCKEFDPFRKLASLDESDKTRGIGIRIVMQTAKVTYKNMYGLNVLVMELKKQESRTAQPV